MTRVRTFWFSRWGIGLVAVLASVCLTLSGCRSGDGSCISDSDCEAGERCVRSGGVLFSSGTCFGVRADGWVSRADGFDHPDGETPTDGSGLDAATDAAQTVDVHPDTTRSDSTKPDVGNMWPKALVDECERANSTRIWCDDFEKDRLDSYFELIDANGRLRRESGVGIAGSGGMVAQFEKGKSSAGNMKLAFGRTPQGYMAPVDSGSRDYREIYWRFYVRHQRGWKGGGTFLLTRAQIFAGEDWSQAMMARLWSGEDDESRRLELEAVSGTNPAGKVQTTMYNDNANFRYLARRQGEMPIFSTAASGVWYCIEGHVRLNDAGQSDGVFEFWIDGKLQARAENLNWVGRYTDYGLNTVFIHNFWYSGTTPADQKRYIDNWVVSTDRIGCGR